MGNPLQTNTSRTMFGPEPPYIPLDIIYNVFNVNQSPAAASGFVLVLARIDRND